MAVRSGRETVNRRRAATAIRVRQELAKRLDRWATAPKWRGTATLEALLTPSARTAGWSTDQLLDLLRRDSRARFPIPSNSARHTASSPADAAQLCAHAESLLAGTWEVFGTPIDVGHSAPQWRTHPLSGVSTPLDHFSRLYYTGEQLGGDVKYIWELNRHAELLRLAQAFALTHDERFAARVCELLDDWITHNPPMRGVNWLSALEVSFRAIVWCWVWQLTAQSRAWSSDRAGRMLWMLAHSARYIEQYDSIHHSPNTHLTGEALGLLYIGTLFPALRGAAHWAEHGTQILLSEIPHQFLHDGFHYERATGYHRYNLEFYLHAFAIARATGASWGAPLREPLLKALQVTAATRKPDGDWPVIGDEDGGAAVRLWAASSRSQAPLLALGAALLNEPDLAFGVDDDANSLAWWFGVEPAHHPTDRRKASFALPDAGYFVAHDRTADTPWYCMVDAGPHGGDRTGHAHTDLGHIELAVGSDTILVDPGCAVYASDTARRDWYRSLAAHTSVCIDDCTLATPRGPFGWSSVAPTPRVSLHDSDGMWACALRYNTTTASPVSHERHVVLVRGAGVVIIDHLSGEGAHHATWHWPLGMQLAEHAFDATGRRATIGAVAMEWSCGDRAMSSTTLNAFRSRTYGQQESVSAVECTVMADQWPLIMVTSFRLHATAPFQVMHSAGDVGIAVDAHRVVRSAPGRLPVLESFSPFAAVGARDIAMQGAR